MRFMLGLIVIGVLAIALPRLTRASGGEVLGAGEGTAGPGGAASQPATQPSQSLVDGSIRYAPPVRWKELGKPGDRLRASFVTPDGHGRIDIAVTVEDRDIPPTMAARMALIIGKAIREQAKKSGQEMLLPPRVEKDPRFFLVVHDRLRLADGQSMADRKQLYRVMGLNLVNVAVVAVVPLSEQASADPILRAGEDLLANMKLTRGATPVVFARSRLWLTTPVDWKLIKQDQPNGPTALYTDPQRPDRQIYVRTRILPKVARDDPAKRDAILEKMIAQERSPLEGSAAADEQPAKSDYLKQVRTSVSRGQKKLTVETRYLVVGDEIVSIRAVAPEADAAVSPLADQLAASARAVP